MNFIDSEIFTYILLPVFIFLARICDVSLGTIRIIPVSKGYKVLAPLIGFFEVLIWIIAISRIMENLNNWVAYVAYAGGFATGNFVGMILEERLAIGYELVRVITKKEADKLISHLKGEGFGLTSVSAKGIEGDVAVLYLVINRKKIDKVIKIIKKFNPNAFYTIEDIRFVNKPVFHKLQEKRNVWRFFSSKK